MMCSTDVFMDINLYHLVVKIVDRVLTFKNVDVKKCICNRRHHKIDKLANLFSKWKL